MELNYKIQNYAWGKRGNNSRVALLQASSSKSFEIGEDEPYAELWLGTHVSGPSSLKSGELLADVLKEHPEYLGDDVRRVFGDDLPFLFKVLSVNQALSIQAHPAKKHAEILHRERPDLYKDPNHKPELAIALTPFEALCGFRPLPEISNFLKTIPELNHVTNNLVDKCQSENCSLAKAALKAVLTCAPKVIRKQLEILMERFKTLDEQQREEQLADLIEKLYGQYPGDAGCFVAYFLNHLELEPFQAIYLGANVPHAYIFGDCIECMACSDNVIRAGLTPKFVDVDTLLSMIVYDGDTAENRIFKPEVEDDYCHIYKPPVPDFAVVQMMVPASLETYTVKKRNSASILLTVDGRAYSDKIRLEPGSAIFLPANEELQIDEITDDLLMYQALANV